MHGALVACRTRTRLQYGSHSFWLRDHCKSSTSHQLVALFIKNIERLLIAGGSTSIVTCTSISLLTLPTDAC